MFLTLFLFEFEGKARSCWSNSQSSISYQTSKDYNVLQIWKHIYLPKRLDYYTTFFSFIFFLILYSGKSWRVAWETKQINTKKVTFVNKKWNVHLFNGKFVLGLCSTSEQFLAVRLIQADVELTFCFTIDFRGKRQFVAYLHFGFCSTPLQTWNMPSCWSCQNVCISRINKTIYNTKGVRPCVTFQLLWRI